MMQDDVNLQIHIQSPLLYWNGKPVCFYCPLTTFGFKFKESMRPKIRISAFIESYLHLDTFNNTEHRVAPFLSDHPNFR